MFKRIKHNILIKNSFMETLGGREPQFVKKEKRKRKTCKNSVLWH